MVLVPLLRIQGTVLSNAHGQTSMYDHYEPWRGHDSAPLLGSNSGLADAPKKKKAVNQTVHQTLRLCGQRVRVKSGDWQML